ncbi:MAG: hypothetical protein R3F43_15490 [bacterium]
MDRQRTATAHRLRRRGRRLASCPSRPPAGCGPVQRRRHRADAIVARPARRSAARPAARIIEQMFERVSRPSSPTGRRAAGPVEAWQSEAATATPTAARHPRPALLGLVGLRRRR